MFGFLEIKNDREGFLPFSVTLMSLTQSTPDNLHFGPTRIISVLLKLLLLLRVILPATVIVSIKMWEKRNADSQFNRID